MGVKEVPPYWRVIKADGSLNAKFPGGAGRQAAYLQEEGYAIEKGKGAKLPKVNNFQKHLKEL